MNFTNASRCEGDPQAILPDLRGLGISSEINAGSTPFNNESYEAMVGCCAPNSVGLIRCTLWCELPDDMMEDIDDADEDEILDAFGACLSANSPNGSGRYNYLTQKGASAPQARAPRLLDVGLVALLTLGLMGLVS
ncbi:hypothetical protein ACJ41O_003994 [Fusarium nematophilum]